MAKNKAQQDTPPANPLPSIHVKSEIGVLKKILIHSPDGGIGKITPGKFHDWLYDDTVHLKKMQEEYDDYIKTLLYFLDPEKINQIKQSLDKGISLRDLMNPGKPEYFCSDKVLDAQWILSRILEDKDIRQRIITAICAIENCNSKVQKHLEEQVQDAELLAKILITGVIPPQNETGVMPPGTDDPEEEIYIFPPVPNFVFTRDIAIIINNHILLSKPAKLVRRRESILTKFVAIHYLFKDNPEKVIEITEDSEFFLLDENEQTEQMITIEGGDIMMIGNNHLIVGCSERTSPNAVNEIVHEMFNRPETGIEWVSVVKVPKKRAIMHIDTIFTQVKRDLWVMYGEFSEELMATKEEKRKSYLNDLMHLKDRKEKEEKQDVEILQFYKHSTETYIQSKDYLLRTPEDYRRAYLDLDKKLRPTRVEKIGSMDALLRQISKICFGCDNTKIIYSGGNQYPYDSREQWTDSCNLLALKEGVVIGYDRNEKTVEQFIEKGMTAIPVKELIAKFERGELHPDEVQNTLILLESGELSRARGGSHCMSMPLVREEFY